jgi:hypothetical protein
MSDETTQTEPIAETPVFEPGVEVPIQTEGLAPAETAPEAVGALGGSGDPVPLKSDNSGNEALGGGGERSEPPFMSPPISSSIPSSVSSPIPPVSSTQTEIPPTPQNTSDSVSPTSVQSKTNLKSLFQKLKEKLSFRTEKRLTKIVELAKQKKTITNDEVEKLLHVSDASASNYLNKLVKRGQLQVSGPKNHSKYSLN